MAIYVIKVTTNKEDRALGLISDKVRKKELNVYSLARPHGLRGYLFLEAEDRESAEEAAYNLPYVKGIIGKTVTFEEIKNMLEPVMEEINIEKRDIVEIIGEPFKKEKARVIRIDKVKGEAVVTLLAAVVPIPVTVKLDNIKVIRREKEDEEETEESKEDKEDREEKESFYKNETANQKGRRLKKEAHSSPEDKEQPLLSQDYEEPTGGLIPDDY